MLDHIQARVQDELMQLYVILALRKSFYSELIEREVLLADNHEHLYYCHHA